MSAHDKDGDVVMDEDVAPEISEEERLAQEKAERKQELNQKAEDFHTEFMANKFTILPGASADKTACSFQFTEEDHTIGNALQYIIMKNPEVEFCGYSIPHPSEAKLNIRIQTYGDITAIEALQKGLDDLVQACDVVKNKFTDAVTDFTSKN